MTMSSFATLSVALLAVLSSSLAAPTSSPFMGTITAPTSETSLTAGSFPFSYSVLNWCEEGYNSFKVFASQSTSEPTFSDLDSQGNIPNALASWGPFTVANFGKFLQKPSMTNIELISKRYTCTNGIGLPQSGTPPPKELTLPPLNDIVSDETMFITVVETFASCPVSVSIAMDRSSYTLAQYCSYVGHVPRVA